MGTASAVSFFFVQLGSISPRSHGVTEKANFFEVDPLPAPFLPDRGSCGRLWMGCGTELHRRGLTWINTDFLWARLMWGRPLGRLFCTTETQREEREPEARL